MKYIQNAKTQNDRQGCIFCNSLKGLDDLVVFTGKNAFSILNLFPYTSGHMMVAPIEHKGSLEELTPQTRNEMMELVSQCVVVLKKVYRPEGFNIGANIGEVAGAGVPDHVHIHIVPRWAGDTNFMTTVGEVRVLPESVEESCKRIRSAWRDLYPSP